MGWSMFRRSTTWFVLSSRFCCLSLAKATSRKTVHMIALVCGGIGLISVYFIANKWMLFLSMAGVGIAWASIFRCLT